jgi:hypothetical protein
MVLNKRVNLRLSEKDYNYLKENNVSPSTLLRLAIMKHRGDL